MPHDIGRLSRPTAMGEVAGVDERTPGKLALEAHTLVSSLGLFVRLLDEPGILVKEHRHYAKDLAALTGALSSLVERVATLEVATACGPVKREALHSRVEQPETGHADAGSAVKSCEELLMAIAGPNARLDVSFEPGLGRLELGQESLTRVLMNLVQNASESMPGGGRITITVRKGPGTGDWAIISVMDTGCGIPAHVLGQVFQAGFSSKQPCGEWPATVHAGLGLTVARELVEGAGGSVRVSSKLKMGTNLELRLPCRRDS